MSGLRRALGTACALAAAIALGSCGGDAPRQPPRATASPAPGSTVVHAAGTSYAAPIYQEVGNRLQGSGLTFNYQLVDGDTVASRLVPRTASVVAAQTTRAMRDLPHTRGTSEMLVPVAFGGVALIYNLPGLHAPLRLRGSALAAIYQERIKRWNDHRIAIDNRGVKLPPLPITIVHRSDASVETDLVTQYMSANDPRWRKSTGSGPAINWPAGTAVSGDAGLRQIVSQTPGAIGYTDQATALQNKLKTVELRNPSGAYVGPTLGAMSAVGRQPHGPGDLTFTTINAPVANAYPITTEAYMLTLTDLCAAGFSHPEATAVQKLLEYMLSEGQAVAHELSFGPLPAELRASARREVRHMLCGAQDV